MDGTDLVRCRPCGRMLPRTAFGPNRARPSGRQSQCRECRKLTNARSYLATAATQNPKRRAWRAANTERNQSWILAYLLAHPCTDCGERDLRVLEFDHVGVKEADISKLIKDTTLRRLQAEVTQCEVVCSNCHAIRTQERAGSWRHRAWLTLQDTSRGVARRRARAGKNGNPPGR